MKKFMVGYLFICDGRDEPNLEYMVIGSYDKTVCPLPCPVMALHLDL